MVSTKVGMKGCGGVGNTNWTILGPGRVQAPCNPYWDSDPSRPKQPTPGPNCMHAGHLKLGYTGSSPGPSWPGDARTGGTSIAARAHREGGLEETRLAQSPEYKRVQVHY